LGKIGNLGLLGMGASAAVSQASIAALGNLVSQEGMQVQMIKANYLY
jgi:mevalonate kinase